MRHLALLCVLAACPGPGRTTSPSAPGAPGGKHASGDRGRLVVLVVVDELPEWSFEAKRGSFTGGIARLLASGDWRSARLPALATSSAAGKAIIATGEPPAVNGIVSDEWWERTQQRVIRADEPGGLRVPTLGDAVVAEKGNSVGVGVDAVSLRLIVGTRGHIVHVDESQTPAPSGTQLGGSPPTGVIATPAGTLRTVSDAAVLAAAQHELDRHDFGRGHTTDFLAISLVDYAHVAHAFGHDAQQAADALHMLDQQLAKLLDTLDHDVGAGRWALVLTSDRGASKSPARGHYTIEQLRLAANNAASLELGSGVDWVAWIQPPTIALTAAALARPKGDLKKAMRKVIYALRAFPELAVVDRADAYEGHCAERKEPDATLCNALDPSRSGDFVFVPASGWIIDSDAALRASASGSLDETDRAVPFLVRGFAKQPTGEPPPPATAPSGEVPASEITSALRRLLVE